ncbi:hypothetical protein EVAR_79901_1 [Eumeta japonica]|uniref:Uncharacterized protein n=1 Tax=Eumeta variegata TaxID=151549 RepID=A0A4C1TYZ7_EUMVA|nr:hypothetical protein EVAR_79901_1 [Eumeta japonica]
MDVPVTFYYLIAIIRAAAGGPDASDLKLRLARYQNESLTPWVGIQERRLGTKSYPVRRFKPSVQDTVSAMATTSSAIDSHWAERGGF